MLLLAEALSVTAIRTVGLVFAILAVVASAVFVRRDSVANDLKVPGSLG
jgi:biopolymer transport protein ExbB/TolQ